MWALTFVEGRVLADDAGAYDRELEFASVEVSRFFIHLRLFCADDNS